MSKRSVLITGASSGIGWELANIYAQKGDDIYLVARNTGNFETLISRFKGQSNFIKYISLDLSIIDNVNRLIDWLKENHVNVDILYNNAGFGDFGFFVESDASKLKEMLNLNMLSLTLLCRSLLPVMIERNTGAIINVASTAAFQPGPLMAAYYASKAYVLHFTEALANEVGDKNIRIMALCPGLTASGFQDKAEMNESKLVKGKKMPSSYQVATFAVEMLNTKKVVAIYGNWNRLMVFFLRFTPRKWVVKVVRGMQAKIGDS